MISATRVDLEASAPSGVYNSTRAIPLAFLAVTVNSAQSGSVLLRWTGQLAAPVTGQPAPAADATLQRGETRIIATGLATAGTLYLADAQGGAFDVVIAADQVPLGIAAVPPPLALTPQRLLFTAGPVAHSPFTVPIDSSVHAVAIAVMNGTLSALTVTGNVSGLTYITSPAQIGAPVPVLSALDTALVVAFTVASSTFPPGISVAVVGMVDDAGVAVSAAGPLPITSAFPALAAVVPGNLVLAGHTSQVVVPLSLGAKIRLYRLLMQWAAGAAGSIIAAAFSPSGTLLMAADGGTANPWVTLDFVGVDSAAGEQLQLENTSAAATGLIQCTAVYSVHL